MVDFTLSASAQAIRTAARGFAKLNLAGARGIYSKHATPAEQFQSTQPIYGEAVKAGLVKGQIPTPVGGASNSLVEAAVLVEEFYAVETSASLIIFGTGLGLTPLALAYQPKFRKFLDPFLTCQGTPLASLVFSEPVGVVSFRLSRNWLLHISFG